MQVANSDLYYVSLLKIPENLDLKDKSLDTNFTTQSSVKDLLFKSLWDILGIFCRKLGGPIGRYITLPTENWSFLKAYMELRLVFAKTGENH